jgi:hypothetical protein
MSRVFAGLVVLIPMFPLLLIYNAEVAPTSPPGLLRKLRVLLFRRLKVFAPAVVGTTTDRFPEMVAVGLPTALLIKANFAEEVVVPPISRSFVELFG